MVGQSMIGMTDADDPDRIDARTLHLVFSNFTRCATCHRSDRIRVHYCPGGCTKKITGSHFHRLCPCGAEWLERSAGHGGFVDLDNPAFVAICQHCRTRMNHVQALAPTSCRLAELSYHDTREPCDLCIEEREPGAEG